MDQDQDQSLTKTLSSFPVQRMFPTTPFIKLGQNFQNISELLKRFGSIPDILELDHLSVSGDVTFGKQVCFKMFRIASAAPDLISLNYR